MRLTYLLAAVAVLAVGALEVGTVLMMGTFGRDSLLMAYCVAIAVTLAATGVVILGLQPLRGRDEGADDDDDGGDEPPDRPPRNDPPRRTPPPSPPAPSEPAWWGQFERDLRGYSATPRQRERSPERELTPA